MKVQEQKQKESKQSWSKLYPVLAIDYGIHHIGLAISDFKGKTAKPLKVLTRKKPDNYTYSFNYIRQVLDEWSVKRILLGSPQPFVTPHQKILDKIKVFENALNNRFNLPIVLYDESFSSARAKDVLLSQGVHEKKARPKIDSYASAVFLQEFLDSKKH